MANDNPKPEQANQALDERVAQAATDVSREEHPQTQRPAHGPASPDKTGQKTARAERTRSTAPADRPAQGTAHNDTPRQPKTPAIAKPGGGSGGEQQGDANPQGDAEVFNQRVFDPTSEDTVVPRGRTSSGPRDGYPSGGSGRPMGGGPRPGERSGGPRPVGSTSYGGSSQGRGPTQGRPGGGTDRPQGAFGPGQRGPRVARAQQTNAAPAAEAARPRRAVFRASLVQADRNVPSPQGGPEGVRGQVAARAVRAPIGWRRRR